VIPSPPAIASKPSACSGSSTSKSGVAFARSGSGMNTTRSPRLVISWRCETRRCVQPRSTRISSSRGGAARVGGGIGERKLDLVLALAALEREARPERDLARPRADQIDDLGIVRDVLEAELPGAVGLALPQTRRRPRARAR
jgi:hypothetical protein